MSEFDREYVVQEAADRLFETSRDDWVRFYREVFGLRGVIRRYYPTVEEIREFETTDTYRQLQQMLKKLREYKPPKLTEEEKEQKERAAKPPEKKPSEPTRVITVRIPRSMHDALKVEAHEYNTSMNKLCISKLLQFADGELVPVEIAENDAAEVGAEATEMAEAEE